VFARSDPGAGRRWLLVLDESHEGSPATSWDPAAGLIESRARDAGGLLEALNLWRTVRRLGGGRVAATDCSDLDEAIGRIADEVADTYPAFELRGLDWPAICGRHAHAVAAAPDSLAALQRWLAELEDSHTWVWPGHANLPYAARLSGGAATFTRVPAPTSAFAAGVRPGWLLVELDGEPPDVEGWLARTAAPPHSRPYLAGRRLLAGPAGEPREVVAAAPTANGSPGRRRRRRDDRPRSPCAGRGWPRERGISGSTPGSGAPASTSASTRHSPSSPAATV
jgi:carboxyl-terminal processing protease